MATGSIACVALAIVVWRGRRREGEYRRQQERAALEHARDRQQLQDRQRKQEEEELLVLVKERSAAGIVDLIPLIGITEQALNAHLSGR
jgi:DNA-directed RNA polymerase subunit F